MWIWFLGRKDPLEEGMATHSSILAWRIPWTLEPGGLQSIGLQRVGHDWSDLACMRVRNNTEKSLYHIPRLLQWGNTWQGYWHWRKPAIHFFALKISVTLWKRRASTKISQVEQIVFRWCFVNLWINFFWLREAEQLLLIHRTADSLTASKFSLTDLTFWGGAMSLHFVSFLGFLKLK